ncbi:MAG: COP23 domain-containing protein [Synechococcaceae cyanobacterium]|nr:COP23 domain-containing protein [Synechococcaceae cyanobacterium]
MAHTLSFPPQSAIAQRLLPTLLGLAGLATGATTLLPAPAQAAATSFSCGASNGVPATIANTDDGRSVPMIRWTSNAFDGAGWTPQRRCQEVSQRFETYRQQGRLAFVTTGRINGLPVICTATSDGGPCDGLLYTLKPGQDPTLALKRLFDVRYKARGPLNETTSRLYLSMDELLGSAAQRDSAAAGTSPVTPASGSDKPLW